MNAPVTIIKDERSAFRTRCAQQVLVTTAGCDNFPAALVDISAEGFRAMVSGQVMAGAPVKLRYAGEHEAAAIVVWQTGMLIGCRFITALSEKDVKQIIRGFGLAPHGIPKFGHEASGGAARTKPASAVS